MLSLSIRPCRIAMRLVKIVLKSKPASSLGGVVALGLAIGASAVGARAIGAIAKGAVDDTEIGKRDHHDSQPPLGRRDRKADREDACREGSETVCCGGPQRRGRKCRTAHAKYEASDLRQSESRHS